MGRMLAAMVFALGACLGTARAAPPRQSIALEAGSGRVITLPGPAANVFAADPKVAEVRPASPTSLFVFGVAPGRTTVAALDASGTTVAQYEVAVSVSGFRASQASSSLDRTLPGHGLQVTPRPNGVLLSGEVRTPAEAQEALAAVRGSVPPGLPIDNRVTVAEPIQVNLRVRVAEMSRNVTRELGVNWQALGNVGRYSVNIMTNNLLNDVTNAASVLGAGYVGSPNVNVMIDALAQDQLVHVLAEPNLTAMSGETASFLVGGEFPIPVGQQNNQVSIEFKQYGISLAFVPTVLSSGRISLRVRPEVSQLTDQGAVRLQAGNASLVIPALTVRRAETTVQLGSGQSFAIAGLLSDSAKLTGDGLPFLGDIPVLGALFRSDSFQRNETELVIVVTPYIVRPVSDPNALRLPTDGWRPPSDLERILLLRQTARGVKSARASIPGDAGFIVQ